MLEEWFLALAASPLVFVAMYLCATIDGFFPPIPSESVVIALSAVAMATGEPSLWLVIAVAAAGAFTGDQVAYAIGRRVHVRSSRLLRSPRARRTLDWAEDALATRGASFIIGARYIPVGRVAVNMTAGAVGFPRLRFLGLTALAAVSWALYSAAIGIGVGAFLRDRPLVAVLVGVVAGVVIGFGVDAVLSRVQGRPHVQRLVVDVVTETQAGVPLEGLDVVDHAGVPQPAAPAGPAGDGAGAGARTTPDEVAPGPTAGTRSGPRPEEAGQVPAGALTALREPLRQPAPVLAVPCRERS